MISAGSIVQLYPGPPSELGEAGPISARVEATSIQFGAVAQLGEHLLCKQGVSGSIPLSSTTRDNGALGAPGRVDEKNLGISL